MNPVACFAAAYAIMDFASWCQRMRWREVYFAKARRASQERGKPMLVVGCPDGWTTKESASWQRHGCGDFTLDIVPCNCPRPIRADVTRLEALPDRVFGATFISCVLEHVDDLPAAWDHLHRVTDGPVYVVHPQWYSPFAWRLDDHNWMIRKAKGGELQAYRIRGAHSNSSSNAVNSAAAR